MCKLITFEHDTIATRELKNRNAESLQEQPRETARFENDEQNVEHGYNTSFEPEQQNRNSLRGNNDAKDSNNILKDKNAKTYTENKEKSTTNTSSEAFSVMDEQHGKNCLRPDNDKVDVSHENNNTYTRTRRRENEAKHSPDDLNKDYIEKIRGNNAKSSVTPGKNNKTSTDLAVKFGQMPEAQLVQRVTGRGTQSGQNVFQQQSSTPKKEQRASLSSECDSQQTTRQVKSKNTYERNPKEPLTKLTVRYIQVAEKTPRANYQDSEQSSQPTTITNTRLCANQ